MKWSGAVLAALLAAQSTPPPRDAVRGATALTRAAIHGRVVDDGGTPVPGAVVVAVGGAAVPGAISFITTEAGTFAIDDLDPGPYAISVAKSGFPAINYRQARPGAPAQPLELKPGQRVELPLVLPRGAAIEGTLLGPEGEPTSGWVIVVRESAVPIGSKKRWASVTSDSGGRFRAFGLAAGTYRIATSSPEAWPADAPPPGTSVSVNAGDERGGIVLRLPPPAVTTYVTVAAAAADGSALRYLEVHIRKPREMNRFFSTGRPNGDGSRTLSDIPAGDYLAVVRSGDYWGAGTVSVDGEHPAALAVTLTRGVEVRGSISGVTPAPPSSSRPISIGLHGADDEGLMDNSQAAFGRVRPDGTFIISGVPPGRYILSTLSSGPDDWVVASTRWNDTDLTDRPLTIGREPVTEVAVTLTKNRTILKGVLTDAAGSPVHGLDVVAYPADPARRSRSYSALGIGRTSVSGEFELRGLPAGRYHLTAVEDADRESLRNPALLAQLTPLATVDVLSDQAVVVNVRLR